VAMLTRYAVAANPATGVAGDPALPAASQTAAAPAASMEPSESGMVESGTASESTTAGTPVIAASHRNATAVTPEPRPAAPPKLAPDGYCAVSISEKSEWLEGNPELGVIHLGNLYLFVDEAAMAKFLTNPEPYTPVLNGIDVV